MEARLDALEGDCSLDASEMDLVWCAVLAECAPPRPLAGGRVSLPADLREAVRDILDRADRRPDFSCSARDWALIRRHLLPEGFADEPPEPPPTRAQPGTAGKVDELCRRAAAGEGLWAPGESPPLPDHVGLVRALGHDPVGRRKRDGVKKPRTDRGGQAVETDLLARAAGPPPTLGQALVAPDETGLWRAGDRGAAAAESGCRRGKYHGA
jgi:hypothetical protein